jgi:hypothetical protein
MRNNLRREKHDVRSCGALVDAQVMTADRNSSSWGGWSRVKRIISWDGPSPPIELMPAQNTRTFKPTYFRSVKATQ